MKQVFPIVPAAGGASGTLLAIGALLVGLLILFGYIAYSTRHVRFEISADGLKISGGIYGRTILAQDLLPAEARAMDLTAEREYRPSWRTNGVGLPGYSAGWFKLSNGQKALAFLTDRTRVVYLPTRAGYVLLLSVASPQEFLRALRASVPGA